MRDRNEFEEIPEMILKEKIFISGFLSLPDEMET